MIFLDQLVLCICEQTIIPDEVIIVSSGLDRNESNTINKALRLHLTNAMHLRRRRIHSAGSNRNFGARRAKNSIVSFFDADDLPHPHRNEILLGEFKAHKTPEQLVLFHGYVEVPRDERAEDVSKYFATEGKAAKTFPLRTQLSVKALKALGSGRLVVLSFANSHHSVAHGHVTLSKTAADTHPFPRRAVRRGEDVILANRLWRNPKNLVAFVDMPLAVYRVGWTSKEASRAGLEWSYPSFTHRTAFKVLNYGRRLVKRTRRLL